ncbi:hypothetical protein B6U74_03010 [Candidatus Bathyarchaeota archaeon ex4484_205]|nr:MAG: hypothetical protein B6U74_03010 [Candidatus Bathyarchaeota archaeon ex4484_205]
MEVSELIKGRFKTRLQLLKLKSRVEIAEKATRILLQKENALVTEFSRTLASYLKLFGEVFDEINRIEEDIKLAEVEIGTLRVDRNIFLRGSHYELNVSQENIFGVELLKMCMKEVGKTTEIFNLNSQPLSLIEARRKALKLTSRLVKLIEVESRLKTLSKEIIETRRRVNALRHFVIPDLKREIEIIKIYLEESEREELIRNKIAKEKEG